MRYDPFYILRLLDREGDILMDVMSKGALVNGPDRPSMKKLVVSINKEKN